MLALVRAALAAALLLLFVPPTHTADKAFQRNDLADAAIKLEAQIKADAGPVSKAAAALRRDADAAFQRHDVRGGLQLLGQVVAAAPDDEQSGINAKAPLIELTYNWDPEDYKGGRNFGHLAYEVDNIYDTCQRLMDAGITINRPPRDGNMAFIRSPDGISIELLQKGPALEKAEPWASMANTGTW